MQIASGRAILPKKQRRPRGPPVGHKRHARDEQKGFGPRQYPIASHVRLNCWTVSELAPEGDQVVIDLASPHSGENGRKWAVGEHDCHAPSDRVFVAQRRWAAQGRCRI
jgi:hypothetical protein